MLIDSELVVFGSSRNRLTLKDNVLPRFWVRASDNQHDRSFLHTVYWGGLQWGGEKIKLKPTFEAIPATVTRLNDSRHPMPRVHASSWKRKGFYRTHTQQECVKFVGLFRLLKLPENHYTKDTTMACQQKKDKTPGSSNKIVCPSSKRDTSTSVGTRRLHRASRKMLILLIFTTESGLLRRHKLLTERNGGGGRTDVAIYSNTATRQCKAAVKANHFPRRNTEEVCLFFFAARFGLAWLGLLVRAALPFCLLPFQGLVGEGSKRRRRRAQRERINSTRKPTASPVASFDERGEISTPPGWCWSKKDKCAIHLMNAGDASEGKPAGHDVRSVVCVLGCAWAAVPFVCVAQSAVRGWSNAMANILFTEQHNRIRAEGFERSWQLPYGHRVYVRVWVVVGKKGTREREWKRQVIFLSIHRYFFGKMGERNRERKGEPLSSACRVWGVGL